MAAGRKVSITVAAVDEATKVFENVANKSLPDLAKRIAVISTSFASVGAAADLMRRSVDAALEAEKATAGLAAALRAQGTDVDSTLPALKRHAEALAKITLADDEAIQGVQKVLISIGNLSGGTLDRATKASLDLAAGLGIDVNDAAEKVGRAAAGATKAFSQLGFEFKGAKTDGEKLDVVLAGIQQRFGGMAEAEIHTATGQLHELNEAFGELLETLGTKLIGGAKGVDALTAALQNLNEEANNERSGGFWTSLAALLGGAVSTTGMGNTAGVITALGAITEDAAGAAGEVEKLSAALDAINNFDDPFGVLAEKAKRHAREVADAADAAEKAAAALAKQLAAIAKADRETGFVGGFSFGVANQGPSNYRANDPTALADAAERARQEALRAQSFVGNNDFAQGPFDPEREGLLKRQADDWATVVAVIREANGGLINYGDELTLVSQATNEWAELMLTTFQDAGTSAALALGDTMIDAAFGMKIAWEDALRDILKGLIKAVAQAAILKAISIAISGGSSAVAGGASASIGGGVLAAAQGGIVPTYAAAGFVPRGTDTIPAMLAPGEMVLPRGVSQAILGGRASVVPAGGGDGGVRNVHVYLGGHHLTSFLIGNRDSFIELNDHLSSRAA